MIECGSLEFAQARLQARHAQRASAAAWQRLETTREFGALLEVARSSALHPWLAGITPASTSHQIEAVLRSHWRALVAEVAGWMPAAWQASVAWCASLPDLPLLQHLARGGEPSAWMHDDPDYRSLCAVARSERRAALAGGKFGALASAWLEPALLARAWRAEWQRRLPERPDDDEHDTLHQLTAALLQHGAAFAAAAPGSGGLLRRSLQARLSLLLRRATLEPAAAFIHVALCALDLERLRGELLSCLLFRRARVA
ncbi:MAG: hypothetical protein JHC40_22185 [Burkholderiales bacterium]|nr:hypothetical protein [Burkholderiales bacterium]